NLRDADGVGLLDRPILRDRHLLGADLFAAGRNSYGVSPSFGPRYAYLNLVAHGALLRDATEGGEGDVVGARHHLASRVAHSRTLIDNRNRDALIADHLPGLLLRHRANHGVGPLPVLEARVGNHDGRLPLLLAPLRDDHAVLAFDFAGFGNHHGPFALL